MTDRELLELAAMAAGVRIDAHTTDVFTPVSMPAGYLVIFNASGGHSFWNPLDDDGDALRLAVKLGIQVTPFLGGSCAVTTPDGWKRTESGYETCIAATRRAITRAAAETERAARNQTNTKD